MTVAWAVPVTSGTIFYAAFTGVLLWCSSLGAGWLENWAVYRRIPEVIEHHRFGRRVGRHRMACLARFFAKHVSGFGGNITLGFLLGMTPVLGTFFGLPLDVRHVTLSAGALALASSTLGGSALAEPAFWWAVAGVALMGVLNFGVSFALALSVALRAREVGWHERVALLRGVVAYFFRRPNEFVLPPVMPHAAPATAAAGEAVSDHPPRPH